MLRTVDTAGVLTQGDLVRFFPKCASCGATMSLELIKAIHPPFYRCCDERQVVQRGVVLVAGKRIEGDLIPSHDRAVQ